MTPEYADAVSDIVGRLGVKARAAGISLVFAAQRPDASVMPMQLRANLGNRLVLRVDGEVSDSDGPDPQARERNNATPPGFRVLRIFRGKNRAEPCWELPLVPHFSAPQILLKFPFIYTGRSLY